MKTLCFIFFCFIKVSVFSQKTEYLVKQTGDTLFGDITLKNKEFIVNTAGANPVIINAKDVRSVEIKKYDGTVVLPCVLHTYTDNLYLIERDQFSSQNIDTVLILSEVYATPKMNLYWCKDKRKTQYYFYKTPADSFPIQLHISYAFGGGATAASEYRSTGLASRDHLEVQKGYVNQLRLIMGDCNKISEGVWELLDYRIYSLKDLIKRFNRCK